MPIGKSISLFLIDGAADGIIAVELFNWTGKGYKTPRSRLKGLSERTDLKKAGVYFLFGRDETDSEVVYIGEAEEVYKRLLQHQDKDFWNEALVFISKDNNLNKAHIKFLEYSIHKLASEAGRYKIFNTNTPNCPAISEAEQVVMTEFSENLQLLVGTLGYKLFEKITKSKVEKHDQYFISAARGAEASGIVTSEGFVVLKESQIATSEVPSAPQAVKDKRKVLIDTEAIINWKFTRDCLFSSPSVAAAVVMGRSANGLVEWKDRDGATLKENQPKSG